MGNYILQETFESGVNENLSGYNGWTGTLTTQLAIESTQFHEGSRGLGLLGINQYTNYKAFSVSQVSTKFTVDFWLYVAAKANDSLAEAPIIPSNGAYVYGTTATWPELVCVNYASASTFYLAHWSAQNIATLSIGAWHHIEMQYNIDLTTASVDYWVDGTHYGPFNCFNNVKTITGISVQSTGSSSSTMYVDAINVYSGARGSQPSPNTDVTFVGVAPIAYGTGLTLIPSSPVGVQVNDVEIMMIMSRSLTAAVTVGDDWTYLTTWVGTNCQFWLYWKRLWMIGDDTPSVSRSVGGTDFWAVIRAYRNVTDFGDAWEAMGSVTEGTSNPALIAGISTISPSSMVVVLLGGESGGVSTATITAVSPANLTPSIISSTNGGGFTSVEGHALNATAAATGAVSLSLNTLITWSGIVISLENTNYNHLKISGQGGTQYGGSATVGSLTINIKIQRLTETERLNETSRRRMRKKRFAPNTISPVDATRRTRKLRKPQPREIENIQDVPVRARKMKRRITTEVLRIIETITKFKWKKVVKVVAKETIRLIETVAQLVELSTGGITFGSGGGATIGDMIFGDNVFGGSENAGAIAAYTFERITLGDLADHRKRFWKRLTTEVVRVVETTKYRVLLKLAKKIVSETVRAVEVIKRRKAILRVMATNTMQVSETHRQMWIRLIFDAMQITETFSKIKRIKISLRDRMYVLEKTKGFSYIKKIVHDTIEMIYDSIFRRITIQALATDFIWLQEMMKRKISIRRRLSEQERVSEQIKRRVTLKRRLATEVARIVDAIPKSRRFKKRVINEVVNVSEAFKTFRIKIIAELMGIQELITRRVTLRRRIAGEVTHINEAAKLHKKIVQRIVTYLMNITDLVPQLQAVGRRFAMSEVLHVVDKSQLSRIRLVAEIMNLVDTIKRRAWMNRITNAVQYVVDSYKKTRIIALTETVRFVDDLQHFRGILQHILEVLHSHETYRLIRVKIVPTDVVRIYDWFYNFHFVFRRILLDTVNIRDRYRKVRVLVLIAEIINIIGKPASHIKGAVYRLNEAIHALDVLIPRRWMKLLLGEIAGIRDRSIRSRVMRNYVSDVETVVDKSIRSRKLRKHLFDQENMVDQLRHVRGFFTIAPLDFIYMIEDSPVWIRIFAKIVSETLNITEIFMSRLWVYTPNLIANVRNLYKGVS